MPAGRPPLFDSPIALQEKIDEYFKTGVTVKTVVVGKAPNNFTVDVEIPTISGMCYFLGFESRQSFYDYEKQPEFTYTVKKARLFIEKHYEEMLQQGNTIGAIFALKNFDWSDKQELNHHVEGEWNITMNLDGGNKVRQTLDRGIPEKDN